MSLTAIEKISRTMEEKGFNKELNPDQSCAMDWSFGDNIKTCIENRSKPEHIAKFIHAALEDYPEVMAELGNRLVE